jgi:tRNA(Ile)-lysidine synthase
MTVDPIQHLSARLATLTPGPLCIGVSGGLDSSVLLHALAMLPRARARGLVALHVDHGLHPSSAQWADHCARLCASLDVALQVEAVDVARVDEYGLEAAARRARHAAFARHLPAGGILALAHHRDDQAETLLLRLLHGAGQEGLAGMRPLRRFARGWLWRPWLDLPRAALAAYARRVGLEWIEDPANADPGFARNHLRHEVLPALERRWPDAAARIAAAAARVREESDVLDGLAAGTLVQAQRDEPGVLHLPLLRTLAPALARRVLGRWLDGLGLPRPPAAIWSRILPELVDARADASPLLAWRGAELRRHRETLHAMAPLPPVDPGWSRAWDGHAPCPLPPGFGRLDFDPVPVPGAFLVRPRRGGERLRQPGAHRELRTLLQDLGVPPWVRARLPLLFDAGGELLAAGDVALAPAFAARLAAAGTRLRWRRDD